jgi:hypothetical protein
MAVPHAFEIPPASELAPAIDLMHQKCAQRCRVLRERFRTAIESEDLRECPDVVIQCDGKERLTRVATAVMQVTRMLRPELNRKHAYLALKRAVEDEFDPLRWSHLGDFVAIEKRLLAHAAKEQQQRGLEAQRSREKHQATTAEFLATVSVYQPLQFSPEEERELAPTFGLKLRQSDERMRDVIVTCLGILDQAKV